MLREELPEKIGRAIYKHIDPIDDLKLYVDGEVRDTNTVSEFVEIRYDGPFLRSSAKNQWMFEYDINLLVQTEAEKNLYALEKVCGKLLVLLSKDISIISEGVTIACSTLKTDFRQKLQINRFGRIESDIRILQATVEARHEFTLEV